MKLSNLSVQPLLQKADRCLASVGIELLLKEPFFAHVLSALGRCFTDEVETLGTCFRNNCFSLLINPNFFVSKITEEKRIALIKHELLHIILGHHLRRPHQASWQESFDIASDLVVNQLVHPWTMPEDAWELRDFPKIAMISDQTADWYYERIKAKTLQRSSRKESAGREIESSSPCSSESCKETTGKDSDDVIQDMSFHPNIQTKRTLKKTNGKNRGTHARWSDDSSSLENKGPEESDKSNSQGLRILQQAKLQNVIKAAKLKVSSKQWGDMPAGLRREIDYVLSDMSGLPWRRILRIFAMTSQQTRLVSTHLRESRRFPGEAGNKIRPIGRELVVAIDTSGSISEEVFKAFFREIHAIQRQKTKITLIQCDAEIQEISSLRNKMVPELSGGGGTSFDPVFEWLKLNKRRRLGGCIYLTDGYGPTPEVDPGCRILWVVTPDGRADSHLRPGRIVQMK